jgi:hypothetical protein
MASTKFVETLENLSILRGLLPAPEITHQVATL